MKKMARIRKIFSIALMLVLLLLTTKVYGAEDRFDTTLKVSASQVKQEANITITIGLKDIEIVSGEKGIGAYTAGIKFDDSVLEYVETNGIGKWEAPFYEDKLITATTKDGKVVNTTQDIGTITFKVKKDAKLGETTISLVNFSGTTAETDVTAKDKTIKVTITDNSNSGNKPTDEDKNPGNDSNNNGSGNGNGNSNEKPGTSNTVDNSTKPGTLPKTGEINIVLPMVIGISTLSMIALFTGIKVFRG